MKRTQTNVLSVLGLASSVLFMFGAASLTSPRPVLAQQIAIHPVSVSVAPSPCKGGATAIGTVTLSGMASHNLLVSLGTNNPAVYEMPQWAIVKAGSNSGTFLIATRPVIQATSGFVFASYGAGTIKTSFTVTP